MRVLEADERAQLRATVRAHEPERGATSKAATAVAAKAVASKAVAATAVAAKAVR